MSSFQELLGQALVFGKLYVREPMSRHTTFRVGGPADYFVEPENKKELSDVLALCRQQAVPYYLLGNGSNLLVGDKGYRGVIVAMGKFWSKIKTEDCRIWAGTGALLSSVANQARKNALAGMEFASGIPGSVGGAVVMNAGAYGSEMADVLEVVTVLTPEGEKRQMTAKELELGYRSSNIPDQGYVVLEAGFLLQPGNPEEISSKTEELAVQRRSKQPLEYPSAGSTFKRPPGHFAGRLIEEAGLRGMSVGGAQVSEKHCGFIINRGGATAEDVLRLCRQVQKQVWENAGVELELEVKLLGEF